MACVPNEEVKRELSIMWVRKLQHLKLGNEYASLISSLLSGDQDGIQRNLEAIVTTVFSFHDLAREPESFYHGFMLASLFSLRNIGYRIESNREHGLGRPDIIIHPPKGKPAIILEFKTRTDTSQVKENDDLIDDAKLALIQIEKREYMKGLEPNVHSVVMCGIAFVKKFVNVQVKSISYSARE